MVVNDEDHLLSRSRKPPAPPRAYVEAVNNGEHFLAPDAQGKIWRLENAEAIAEMNRFVEQQGLPQSKWRQF
ncbi:type II toxin-antitoxin system CcdA family antitoxin [Rhizobium tubonense]|uniref:Uncharacterized protein n=1 Tax=Rhizobium tubonense TaxID=484088 RepID=A0A2W4CCH0_9HYPH|nr:type II toxin-antitoxin system CcdA family antitoxin [Rhizobium tubonense]PZM10929.1 hypothetical protein CPY51_21945 [Rhizobium tubonense]